MTTAKYGISAINKNNNDNNSGTLGKLLFDQANSLRAVRVTSIVLDENHPRFKELGEWNGLGTIEYQDVITPKVTTSTAKPLLGNNKTFPLINEIVYLLTLPSNKRSESTGPVTSYYVNIVSLWNHPHHNAYPTNPNTLPPAQQQDYVQTELGSIRRITDQSSEIYLGKTFVERANIHPLLPFEGDIINEGRWGNSIRLGSTVATKTNNPIGLNNWSVTGSSGDPIIIIRNGQGTQVGDEGWIPVIENINDNDSSIYLTSTQALPLQASSTSYNSYSTQPQSPNQFSGKQIVLNSGRLVFNSSNNHILLSSNQSVGLNAISSVNIDTPLTVIQSNKVLLGSKDATESILKGDSLVKELTNLIEQIIKVNTLLTNVPQIGGVTNGINTELLKIMNAIELTKSKVSKTI
jgi:hypothetical protein